MANESMDYAYYTDTGQDPDRVEYLPYNGYDAQIQINLPTLNETDNSTSWANQTMPQPYQIWEMALISAVIIPTIFGIIFGNALVCIVIHKERQLKTVQNWFIASLAIADLLVGMIIMPFTLANEVMGYWVFGSILCDLWLAADVLLCTASILHLCLISLDRYWSITQAIDYVRKRTPKRAKIMIATVWVLSASVCLPPLIGWKGPRDTSRYPSCSISDDVGYVVYSCMGSFYVPLCVMIIVYFRIYLAARDRAMRSLKKTEADKEQKNLLVSLCSCHKPEQTHHELSCFSKAPSSDSNEKDHNSDSEFSEYPSKEPKRTGEFKSCEEIHDLIEDSKSPCKNSSDDSGLTQDVIHHDNGFKMIHNETKPKNEDCCVYDGHLCPPKKSSIRQHDGKQSTSEKSPLTRTLSNNTRCKNDAEKQKRRLARARERRATIVLGIIMAAFTLCWFPFFTMYMIATIAHVYISDPVFKFFFWLGYFNSGFNPVIYTIFNRDFKQAFYKLLCQRSKH